MLKIEILAAALLLAVAAPLAAQEADSAAAEATVAPAAEQPQAHDWEFTLAATDKAPGASATVMVTDDQDANAFVLVANGLPVIDELDEEGRDVNAYTVWIVPGKDKVAESELAGVLTVTPEGSGRLEGETSLETFGVIVTATPDGAPEKIGGVPVLTGIPVQQAPAEEAVEEAAEAAEEAGEAAEEMGEEAAEAAEEVGEEAAEVVEEVEEAAEEAAEDAPDATPDANP